MESWKPLLDIFLNSPAPESEASLWLQSQQSSSSSSSTVVTPVSFLSLLMKPNEAALTSGASTSSNSGLYPAKSVMWIQTLPDMVQSRILSFLVMDHRRFCAKSLSRLAKKMLQRVEEGVVVDFWVQRAARNLLDVLSDSSFDWVSGLSLISDEQREEDDDFDAIPEWLKDAAETRGGATLFPWLPAWSGELKAVGLESCAMFENDLVSSTEDGEGDNKEDGDGMMVDSPVYVQADSHSTATAPLSSEIVKTAELLKTQILCFESTSKTVALANEMKNLCMGRGLDSLQVLALIEPWKADNETASILISHLTKPDDKELAWPSQVLCSIILPMLLVLEEPASRILTAAIVEYCKMHQRAAVHALLLPLLFRRQGINKHISDLITRIIKESLHPAHASPLFQTLWCGDIKESNSLTLPCHQNLLSKDVVWNESLFSLFQSILNHDIHLTQDAVDNLVHRIPKLADTFSTSLKFGNFLLRLVTKFSSMLKPHKLLLSETVRRTNTLVTKSVMAKLANL